MGENEILVVGGICIDEITDSDGVVHSGLLGGNAVYAGFGASCWLKPGATHLRALVGNDFPRLWRDSLVDSGIDVSDVTRLAGRKTMAFVAAYSEADVRDLGDGGRGPSELEPSLTRAAEIPSHVSGVYLGPVHPSTLMTSVTTLGEVAGVTVLIDPGEESLEWTPDVRTAVLAAATIVCPSEADLPPEQVGGLDDVCDALLGQGPEVVVIKLGSEGCLVATRDRRVRVPAYPTDPVDPTGAGDTFCGAYLAAWLTYRDPAVAAVLAGATASCVVEERGLLASLAVDRVEIHRRARWIAERSAISIPTLSA